VAGSARLRECIGIENEEIAQSERQRELFVERGVNDAQRQVGECDRLGGAEGIMAAPDLHASDVMLLASHS